MGPKEGESRGIHYEEFHHLYRSLTIVRGIKSRRLRWAGHAARKEEGKCALKILREWEDNIRIDLKEIDVK